MAEARLPLYAPRGPSLARATAMSGATTVNLLVLGALLLPATLAPTLEGPRRAEHEPALLATVVEVAAAVLPPSPAPAPASVAPAAPPRPLAARAAPTVPTAVAAPVEAPVAVATPAPPTDALPGAPEVAPAGPAEGVLAYVHAPQPAYPRSALRRRAEGTVLLRVRVDARGLPVAVEVARSSGHDALDDAARRKVLRDWRFRPALRDGRAVEAVGLVPVAFRLDAG